MRLERVSYSGTTSSTLPSAPATPVTAPAVLPGGKMGAADTQDAVIEESSEDDEDQQKLGSSGAAKAKEAVAKVKEEKLRRAEKHGEKAHGDLQGRGASQMARSV